MAVEPSRAKAIFLEAVDKAALDERGAFVEQACANDAELRQRVQALLQAHEAALDVLDRPAAEQFSAPSPGKGSIPVFDPQPPTPVDDVPHAQAKFEESAQIFTAAGTDCSKMCKALASMERAAGHLCDLVKTGVAADKKKCTDAKARVDHARDRVISTCGGCDG